MKSRKPKRTASMPSMGEQFASSGQSSAMDIRPARTRTPVPKKEETSPKKPVEQSLPEETDPLAGAPVADDLKIVHPRFRKKKRTQHSTSIRLPAKTMDIVTMYRNNPVMHIDRPDDPAMTQSEFLRMLIDHSLYQLQAAMAEGNQEAIDDMLAWVPRNDEED